MVKTVENAPCDNPQVAPALDRPPARIMRNVIHHYLITSTDFLDSAPNLSAAPPFRLMPVLEETRG